MRSSRGGRCDAAHPSGCRPILIKDIFAHAFMIGYGLKETDDIEAFFKNINWATAESSMVSKKEG